MNDILDAILPNLSANDDLHLWRTVIEIARHEIDRELVENETTRDVFLVVGPCSTWLRPHQTRWRVGNLEFAWPSGYGGVGQSRTGLPAFDWCNCFQFNVDGSYTHVNTPDRLRSRQLALRVAIPSRTIDRRKASINLLWTPGTPRHARRPVARLLALSRDKGDWKLVGSLLQSGELWRGELFPPPNRRISVT